jgi:hypothetical protein
VRRFAAPEKPLDETGMGVQAGAAGNMCVQIVPQYTLDLSKNASKAGGGGGAADAVGKLFGSLFAGVAPVLFKGDEDCLFLDVYVPGAALRGEGKKLAVASWYYGGAVSGFLGGLDGANWSSSVRFAVRVWVELTWDSVRDEGRVWHVRSYRADQGVEEPVHLDRKQLPARGIRMARGDDDGARVDA